MKNPFSPKDGGTKWPFSTSFLQCEHVCLGLGKKDWRDCFLFLGIFIGRVIYSKGLRKSRMNFISAKNCPLYMNLSQDDGAINTGVHFFVATSVSLGVDSSLSATKIFGQPRLSNDFSHDSTQVGKLSVEVLPLIGTNSAVNTANQMALITGVTGDYVSGFRCQFGNLDLRKCYLSSLSLKISPQEMISINADFDVYDLSRVTGQAFTGANIYNLLTTDGSGAYLEGIHALAMGVSGSGLSLPECKNEIDISYNCAREPSYPLGSTEPSTVILTSVERHFMYDAYPTLPIVQIDDWNEVLEPKFLENKANEILSKELDYSPLYMKYWSEKLYGIG